MRSTCLNAACGPWCSLFRVLLLVDTNVAVLAAFMASFYVFNAITNEEKSLTDAEKHRGT